ncbi:MAG: calycin-like domain-containing protein [Mediterranea sp.]|jgi:hypothetical protein|nr:calycin-like domain-containing protein [Mediterranea sp.]
MKKNLFFAGLMLCMLAMLSSCDKKKDEPNVVDPVGSVVGTYNGNIDIKMNGSTIGAIPAADIVIAKVSDKEVSLSLSNFVIDNLLTEPATIKIDKCAVAESGEGYTLTGKQDVTLSLPLLGPTTCPVEITNGVIKNGVFTLILTVQAPVMGQTIPVVVNFTGTRK